MKLGFLTDTHLGVLRQSHTTPDSRRRLQQVMKDSAFSAADTLYAQGPVFHLGDLFDTWTNEESVIDDGLKLMNKLTRCLAGNHDLPGREGKLSSLQLIHSALESPKLVVARVDESGYDFWEDTEHLLVFVPHHASQGMFEAALTEADSFAETQAFRYKILCLHTNYDLGFESTDSTLNLTRHRAEGLLNTFGLILIGHEHIARSDFGGRLQVLGNLHPTSFNDISDKFIWTFDKGALTGQKVWSKDQGWALLDCNDLSVLPASEGLQFIEVTGVAPAEHLPAIARSVSDLWSAYPDALMIRNTVSVEQSVVAPITTADVRAMDLPGRIGEELKGTPLLKPWNEYLARAQEAHQ